MKFRLKWCFHGNIAYFFFTVTFFFLTLMREVDGKGRCYGGQVRGEGGMLDFERLNNILSGIY